MPACAPAKPPCVEITVSASTLRVGDTAIVSGRAPEMGNPNKFALYVRDAGSEDFAQLVNVPSKGEGYKRESADVSQVLELVSVQYVLDRLEVTLRARKQGSADLYFNVDGENYCRFETGSYTADEVSKTISITVSS